MRERTRKGEARWCCLRSARARCTSRAANFHPPSQPSTHNAMIPQELSRAEFCTAFAYNELHTLTMSSYTAGSARTFSHLRVACLCEKVEEQGLLIFLPDLHLTHSHFKQDDEQSYDQHRTAGGRHTSALHRREAWRVSSPLELPLCPCSLSLLIISPPYSSHLQIHQHLQ